MKTPFIVVSGPHERRFAEAVTAIDAILVG